MDTRVWSAVSTRKTAYAAGLQEESVFRLITMPLVRGELVGVRLSAAFTR